MRGFCARLGALGLVLLAAGWTYADTVTFDFAGEGGVLSSVTVAGSNPVYSATATGATYTSSLSSGGPLFMHTPSFASDNPVQINQHDLGLGVDSDSFATEVGTDNRRIQSYATYAEVLWVTIAPPTGYTITSATLINVEDGETGGVLDVNGNVLTVSPSADKLNLTFTPPANSNIFGVYESNRGSHADAPGIKLSQFQITLSPTAAPLPSAAWAGGLLLVGLAVRKGRRGALAPM